MRICVYQRPDHSWWADFTRPDDAIMVSEYVIDTIERARVLRGSPDNRVPDRFIALLDRIEGMFLHDAASDVGGSGVGR